MKSTLFLIPTPLAETHSSWLLDHERQKILHIQHFAAESPKTARLHLKKLNWPCPIQRLHFFLLDKRMDASVMLQLLDLLNTGNDVGLLSECGCPAVADPGAKLVALAHDKNHRVLPLIGPCSILLALMSSGAFAQRFVFHGYLPKNNHERIQALKILEKRSEKYNEAQIFMETPYRNDLLLQTCLSVLKPETRLAVASELTLPTQQIISQRIKDWPTPPALHKKPCVFICHAKA